MPGRPAETGPKRRCAATTRAAILDAATRRFAAQGYERSGAREIAADAGVTAALVNRYFGSKERLFAEVIARAFDHGDVLAGGRADLAVRLARHAVYGRQDDRDVCRTPLLLLLQSATEPFAAGLLRENLDRSFVRPLSGLLGGPDAEARAALVAAVLTGFATLDQMIRSKALAGVERERMVAFLAALLNTCMD